MQNDTRRVYSARGRKSEIEQKWLEPPFRERVIWSKRGGREGISDTSFRSSKEST